MKILQICHKVPYPPTDGGTIAMNNLTQGLLNSGHDVKVLAIETPKHPVTNDQLSSDYVQKVHFESVFIDTSLSLFSALKTVFSKQSYQVQRFYSKELATRLTHILKQETYDVVQLESIYTTPYIPVIQKYSNAKIVLRTHNVEHFIWARIVKNEKNIFKKLILHYLTFQLKRYECSLSKKIDAFIAISHPDYLFFHQHYNHIPGMVIPFGVDVDAYENNEENIPSPAPSLFYVGSMDWLPNIEGIHWFLEEVWDTILEKFPDVTFTIAGRKMPDEMFHSSFKNVVIVGEVPSAIDFIRSQDIMIVPLLSGSGVRVKIIEGMALGKVVIATSIAAEGLDVEDGKNILIANTPEQFVAAIEKCVKIPDVCTIIGENAQNFVALYHNNEVIIKDLIKFYESIL